MVTEKSCTRCGELKPISEFHKKRPGQYQSWCKSCQNEANAVKRKANAHPYVRPLTKACGRCGVVLPVEQFPKRGGGNGYRSVCHECRGILEKERKLRKKEKDPDAWYAANAAYRTAVGSEELSARVQRWHEKDPEHAHDVRWEAKQLRRARQHNLVGNTTAEEWKALKAYFGNRCLSCGRQEPEIKLTRDHVIPVTAEGSSEWLSNMQPLCETCNKKKFTKTRDLRHFLTPLPEIIKQALRREQLAYEDIAILT